MTRKSDSILKKDFEKNGPTSLGLNTNYMWNNDPKKLFISMARYKFVSRMINGKKNILEVGGEPFRSRIVKQTVKNLTVITKEKFTFDEGKKGGKNKFKINFILENPVKKKLNFKNKFDAIYCLDFINKLSKKENIFFLNNILHNLDKKGIFLLGTPSKESSNHASDISKIVNKNLYSSNDLKKLLKKYFGNVFIFSMNDELVHTGYSKMAHYLIALCANKIK